MKKISELKLLFIITTVFLNACYGEPAPIVNNNGSEIKEKLIEVNKQLVKQEIVIITELATKNNWKLKQAASGFWYDIYSDVQNPLIKTNNTIFFNYTLTLIDGTLCYSSEKDGKSRAITIGKATSETGLEQAMLLLSKGDKAHIVLPPHLAFGLTGDDKKIPARAIIIYDIEILDVQLK